MANKIIISGGGTGGHIFPALSIAGAIKKIDPSAEILFVGAEGKMEMEKVPAAGYKIIGLPVAGLKRSFSFSNFAVPFKVMKSLSIAGKILKDFQPDVVVVVGGYASAPTLWKAESKKIPCLIQEQNSYAGLTNKIVGKKALKICVAYDGMERFFPEDKIIFTGNPIRSNIHPADEETRKKALEYFKLDPSKQTVFIVGGSLGCGTLNSVMKQWCTERGIDADYQIIWQSGKGYHDSTEALFSGFEETVREGDSRIWRNVRNSDFISRMDYAFAAADIIVSRAGAGTISELCAAGKASIFVPSPVVAEDHQTHNAMSLTSKDAALMVRDDDASEMLIPAVEKLLADKEKIKTLEENILKMAKPDAAEDIAKEVLSLIKK